MVCLYDINGAVVKAALNSFSSSTFSNAKEKETNTMLFLRALSNIANTSNGKRVLSSNAAEVCLKTLFYDCKHSYLYEGN